MRSRLANLERRHRRLDRLIDTTKALGRQEDIQILKRIRLRLKDRITEIRRRGQPITR